MLGQKSIVRGLNSERLDGLGKGLVCSGAQYSGGQVSFVLLGRMEATWKLCGRRGDRGGCLSCFAFSVISPSCSPLCKMGHSEMKQLRFNCFSRQPGCIVDRFLQRQTFLFKMLLAPDLWLLPPGSGFSVFPSMCVVCV